MVFEYEAYSMRAIQCEIREKKLFINGGEVDLQAEVMKFQLIGERVVVEINVLLRNGQRIITPQNIFMLDADGQVVWQIEEFKEVKGRSSYYTNIWVDESGRLHASNPLGFDCVIDIETGKIKSYEFTK